MGDDRRTARGRLLPPLLLAFVSAAATAATIAAGTGDGSPGRTVVATSPNVGVSLPATTTTPPPQPPPTVTTGTLPAAPGAPSTVQTTTAPPPRRPPRRRVVRSWPSGRSGYTVVLLSLPQSDGRAAALARARGALAAGLPQVGVLDSSGHASLRGGYWVVFSGLYATERRAQAAAAAAHARGFPGAYPARVSA